jgi:hypothetical protein
MKFYEMVENCKWENVQPVILTICRSRGPQKYVDQSESEKEKEYDCFEDAFNRLKNTKPVESDTKITIDKFFDDDERCIDVSCICKGDKHRCAFCYPWDESLGMEIVLENDLTLSQEEIVANCLWEMTFWGFSWEEITDHFSSSLSQID